MKILLFDIEIAPSIAKYWGDRHYDTNIISDERYWYMLSFAYKWLDLERPEKGKVRVSALPDFPLYKKEPENDKHLVERLWRLFDEADIVIAHNAKRFDTKKSNVRFLKHNFDPPSNYAVVDTLVIAKQAFAFPSNSLNELAKFLGIGHKLPHTGMDMWNDCEAGSKKAWKLMKRYNKVDVELLEKVYLRLRPWATTHPHVSIGRELSCHICAGKVVLRGVRTFSTGIWQRTKCTSCGKWGRVGGNLVDKETRRLQVKK